MTQRFKYQGNNEYGLDVYYDRYNECHYVNIPHTHVGWGSGTRERANNQALSADAERCGQMNIDDMFDVSGTYLAAIVDNYTISQWELLEELVSDLNDYPIYDETLFLDIERESQLDFIAEALDYDDDVEPADVLNAIHDSGVLFEEEEGENWYISADDFANAVDYAKSL